MITINSLITKLENQTLDISGQVTLKELLKRKATISLRLYWQNRDESSLNRWRDDYFTWRGTCFDINKREYEDPPIKFMKRMSLI